MKDSSNSIKMFFTFEDSLFIQIIIQARRLINEDVSPPQNYIVHL